MPRPQRPGPIYTTGDVIDTLIDNWLNNLGGAFTNAWRRFVQTWDDLDTQARDQELTSDWWWLPDWVVQIKGGMKVGWYFLLSLVNVAGIIDTAIGDVFSAQNEAMISTALKFLVPPPDWLGSGIITRKRMWSEVLNFMLSTGYGIVSLHVPLPVKIALFVKTWRNRFKLLGNGVPIVLKVFDFLEKRLKKALKLGVVTIILTIAQFWGCFLLITLAWFFVDLVHSNQLLPQLSQKAPRKKVHPKEGGVIRRRMPGGSIP